MAAEGGEYTREKEKQKKQQVATGGAEQERKGAPRCVRVSVPVRPDLCLSDRQRRERKTRERRRSHSAKQEERSLLVPNPNQTVIRGWWGGGWVHRQVVATCRRPVPSGQATREREDEEETTAKERKRKQYINKSYKIKQFSGYRREAMSKRHPTSKKPKTKGTLSLYNIQPRQRKKGAQAKREQHSVLFSIPRKDRNNPHRVQQILSQQLSKLRPEPRRTLPKQTIKETNSARKRKRGKRAAFCAVSTVTRVPNSSR